MAELQHIAKRQRDLEGPLVDIIHDDKRYKSSNNQISCSNMLEHEQEHHDHQELEEVSSQELSVLLTTLQQELFDPLLPGPNQNEESGPSHETSGLASPSSTSAGENDDKEQMIKHILEATDDELGLPNRMDGGCGGGDGDEDFNGASFDVAHSLFSVCDGLWELEDEAANYYTLLQAQLFMY